MPERRATTRRSIAVVGAGYVGLVSAVGFAAMGHVIELVETDPRRQRCFAIWGSDTTASAPLRARSRLPADERPGPLKRPQASTQDDGVSVSHARTGPFVNVYAP